MRITGRGLAIILSLTISPIGMTAEPFVFTAIPDQDESRLQQRFNRVAEYLAAELDVEVRFVPVKSYAAAVTAFRNNEVQLAWFGGLSGVRARTLTPGSEAIAQGYEDQFFTTYFIAHATTNLEPNTEFPKGIAGKTFTFGSKGSTSGRLMPEFYIRKHLGQSPDDLFSRVGFSGNHSKTIALVQSGAYDVGAVNFKVWEGKSDAGLIDSTQVRIIWETPPYPDYQWTIRGDVDSVWGPEFKDRVAQAFLTMTDPELLDAFPRGRFVAAKNEDYQPILDVARQIGLID